MISRIKMNQTSLCGLFFFAMSLSSCSNETSPEDTPVPISNRNGERGQVIGAPRTSASQKKTAASPSASVSRPTVQCSFTTSTETPQPVGLEKNGAVIAITENTTLNDPILVYRLPGSVSVEGSFLAVEDMVFGPEGTHGTGAYVFELRTADERSCYISLGVSDDDAAAKKNLIISPVFP
jgi:hypothetical protein